MEDSAIGLAVETAEQARAELSSRLAERRAEIEQAMFTRVCAISDPYEVSDPEYLDGLRAALRAALDYGLVAIERGEEHAPQAPAALLTQARVASRSKVSLDTVLRRYFAGYSLLGDFLIEEAEREGLLDSTTLKRLLRSQAAVFDRLISAVTEEHRRELTDRVEGSGERRLERIRRLLAGELIDTSGIAYDFEADHLGLIAQGPGAAQALRDLAASFDGRFLVVNNAGEQAWGWLGASEEIGSRALEQLSSANPPAGVALAHGEPAHGLEGWRLTHRQARVTLQIALRSPGQTVRYADVALVASLAHDDLLATSLHRLYLDRLAEEKDGGGVLRQTLRTYFATDHNVSSAAAVLGVSRQAVAKRLCQVEQRLDRTLAECRVELELALRLDALSSP